MATCSSVLGTILVVLVFVALTVSSGFPAWLVGSNFSAGLWLECNQTECSFIGFNTTDLPRWFNPVRIVNSVAVANALLAAVFAVFYLTCSCCSYSVRTVQFLIIVLVIGGLENTASFVTYAMKGMDTSYAYYDVPSDLHFGWCFHLAAACIIGFFISFVLFLCETSNLAPRRDYEPLRPTTYA